jgi:hypothetical protein
VSLDLATITEVDDCSAKGHLETDSDENVRFYEKFGFKVIFKSDIFQVENRYLVRVFSNDFG